MIISQAVYGYDQRLEVFGEKGAVARIIVNNSTSVKTEGVVKDKPLYFFLERYTQAYIEEVTQFTKSIIEGQAVICSGNDGLQAERIAKVEGIFINRKTCSN